MQIHGVTVSKYSGLDSQSGPFQHWGAFWRLEWFPRSGNARWGSSKLAAYLLLRNERDFLGICAPESAQLVPAAPGRRAAELVLQVWLKKIKECIYIYSFTQVYFIFYFLLLIIIMDKTKISDLMKKKLLVPVDVACVLFAFLPSFILTVRFKPFKRGIHCDDESLMYPLKPDTFTNSMMAVLTICSSLIIISTGEAFLVWKKKVYSKTSFNQYVAALYKVVGTFLFGAAVSQSLTDVAKFTIGRPRPNFMAVCAPTYCSGYMLEINCTGNSHQVTESRLSFFSGHSSFGMYCMLFLALYLQARLGAKWARLVRPTIQFFLLAMAVFVGYTRVSDYKHHWSDVLVGLLQGALVAVLNVLFVSDFFKERPPRRQVEEPGTKPNLQITDVEQGNHYADHLLESARRHPNLHHSF